MTIRERGKGRRADEKVAKNGGQARPQAAHLEHVVLVVQRFDDHAGRRKSRALKKACVMKWKMAAAHAPTPSARNI